MDTVSKRFREYVAGYDPEDPKIALKIAHSYRVASLCREIAETLAAEMKDAETADAETADATDMDAADAETLDAEQAYRIGLLHDIGRFEQIRRFGTFNDANSIDHADLGAEILEETDLLQEAGVADPGDRELMITAIRLHNKYRLPEGLTPGERLYCRIIRDADKLDIFRVLTEESFENVYGVSEAEMARESVSEAVKDCCRAGTAVPRQLRETSVDILVSHICLVFELEFEESRRIAERQGYLEQLLEFESESEDTREWFAYLKEAVGKERL